MVVMVVIGLFRERLEMLVGIGGQTWSLSLERRVGKGPSRLLPLESCVGFAPHWFVLVEWSIPMVAELGALMGGRLGLAGHQVDVLGHERAHSRARQSLHALGRLESFPLEDSRVSHWKTREMAYHSAWNAAQDLGTACGCAILPLRNAATKGPAPLYDQVKYQSYSLDILDEVIYFFKANVLFKHFEVKGPADRILVYMTLYATLCLKKIETCADDPEKAHKALQMLAYEDFSMPGDAAFPLGSFFPAPQTSNEKDLFRAYMKQLREELGKRLVSRVFGEEGSASKFWLVFAKRKFMNKVLS